MVNDGASWWQTEDGNIGINDGGHATYEFEVTTEGNYYIYVTYKQNYNTNQDLNGDGVYNELDGTKFDVIINGITVADDVIGPKCSKVGDEVQAVTIKVAVNVPLYEGVNTLRIVNDGGIKALFVVGAPIALESAGEVTPPVTEPDETEPDETEPETTEPEATEPEATEPEATEPEATEPEFTLPEGTEPDSAPETGDFVSVIMALLAVSALGLAVVLGKKRF